MKVERVVLVAILSLVAVGCGNNDTRLTDDEGSASEGLSNPFARGTTLNLHVTNTGDNTTGWQVVSDNPAVFAVEDVKFENNAITAVGRAVADGETTLRVLHDGKEVTRELALVKSANQARVYSHASFRISGRTDTALAAAQLTSANVVVGGKASFAVGYFKDSERLFGRGIAQVTPNAAFTVENKTASGAVCNEFLFVTPSIAGSQMLEIKQGDTTLATLPIEAIEPTALQAITLVEEQGTDGKNDENVWLFAKVTDNQQRDVLGVYVDWLKNGEPQKNTQGQSVSGDLYRYVRKSSATATVTAQLGTITATKEVHADAGSVYDTTFLGCSAMGDPATSAAMLLLVAGAALIARRSRRIA